MPRLPFKPEPLAELRARYKEAIADPIDLESVKLGLCMRPGEQRRHVFDHEDGMRLIVSREAAAGLPLAVHLSASLEKGYPLWDKAIEHGHAWFVDLVPGYFFRLRERGLSMLQLVGLSDIGVPHFHEVQDPALDHVVADIIEDIVAGDQSDG